MNVIVFLVFLFGFSVIGYGIAMKPTLKGAIKLAWIIAILPFSSIFVSYYYKMGIVATDGIFIGVALFLIFSKTAKVTISYKIIIGLFLIFLLVCINALVNIEQANIHLSSLFKDIKIIAYIPLFYFFYLTVSRRYSMTSPDAPISEFSKSLALISFAAAIKCIILQQLNAGGYLSSAIEGADLFYTADEEMMGRYSDFSLPLAFSFLLMLSLLEKQYLRFNFTLLLQIGSYFTICYASGNRTFFVAGTLVALYLLIRANRLAGLTLVVTIVISILSLISYSGDIFTRFYDLASFDLISALLQTRFSPFFDWLNNQHSPRSIFLGNGIGVPFYIPWFDYRDNIDSYSPFIDNLYLTIVYKYGIVGMVAMIVFLAIKWFNHPKSIAQRFIVGVPIILCGMTMSIVYQSYFVTITVWLLLAHIAITARSNIHDKNFTRSLPISS